MLYDVLKAQISDAAKLALVKKFDEVLSLNLISAAEKLKKETAEAESEEIPAEIAELLEQRKAARKEKNFALADELRAKINELGYTVEETRQGTKVYKTAK